ncbi:MAG: hypothetical protein J1E64_00455 [Acetatifactor sp.]|nr:hypothetical protein [Acetatifactor sp.]
MILKQELCDGYLTEREYHNYVKLFHFAANRVLAKHPQMQEEVNQMTEPLIKLPSMIMDELEAEIADRDAKIASKDAEIRRLQELISQLSSCNSTP